MEAMMLNTTRRGFIILGAAAVLAACSTTIPVLPKSASSTPETLGDAEILSAINAVRRWKFPPGKVTKYVRPIVFKLN